MKNRTRHLLIVGVLVSLGTLVCVWLLYRAPRQVEFPIDTRRTSASDTNLQFVPQTPARTAETGSSTQRQHRIERFQDAINKTQIATAAKNVPIAFWGKVVDEGERPLSGVLVMMETREWRSPGLSQVQASFQKHQVTTGTDGLFQLTGPKGDVLTIKSLQKHGYQSSPKALRSFGYNISSNHLPDPKSPVVLKMWALGSPDPLITAERFFGIIPDGRTYTVDLLKGTKVEADNVVGDLRVRITRPLLVERNAKYSWHFMVDAVDGGIIETGDELMIRAPESGYLPRYEARFEEDASDWRDEVTSQFYLKSRNGQGFAKIKAEVFANYNGKAIFSIDYAINTNGSRNLEPGGKQLSPLSN